ncbi:MAG TPA: hypothetical protein P5274_00320 [Candidatus Paceibacterota bacterium]|nr:hypothetical protein [Candidatus Paceibacterota bacterium]
MFIYCIIEGMRVGYFKVDPPALPVKRDLVSSRHKVRSLVTVPLTGLVLGVIMLGGLQLGIKLNDFNLPKERYQTVASITLPASVSFLSPAYDLFFNLASKTVGWSQDTWANFISNWRVFLGLESAPLDLPVFQSTADIPLELREQLRQEILVELRAGQTINNEVFGGEVPANKPIYALTAVPASGSTTIDRSIKQTLTQVFADPFDIKFDENGSSGFITPIFQDGRRGDSYVFVLTPTR